MTSVTLTIPRPDEIRTPDDVATWFRQLTEAGFIFHPDDSMVLTCDERERLGFPADPGCSRDPCPGHVQYINAATGEPSMSLEEGRRYDLAMTKCFEAVGDGDIYVIGMEASALTSNDGGTGP